MYGMTPGQQRIRQVYSLRENSVAKVTLFCFLMRE